MSARRSILAAFVLCAASCVVLLRAQTQHREAVNDAIRPLDHGTLVLWIVHNLPPSPERLYSGTVHHPNTIQETTAGRFGTPAGDVGQTAGTYGKPTSSLGTPAGSVGQTAGTYGQTAGTYGQNSSATGQSAGSYGQTAGTYGQTAGRYGESVNTMNDADARTHHAAEEAYHHPPHDHLWNNWLETLHAAFPDLHLDVVDVRSDELEADLKAVHNTPQQPDVLLDHPLPSLWTNPNTGLEREYGISTLATPAHLAQVEAKPGETSNPSPWRPEASMLHAAPHPREARALIVWLQSGSSPPHLILAAGLPEDVARHALANLLEGSGITADADPDAAPLDPSLARVEALNSTRLADPFTAHIDVMQSYSNDRFAVVALRAQLSTPNTFGVVNSFAVLRKDSHGRWRVLQITPSLAHAQDRDAVAMLSPLAHGNDPAHVAGIAQASPGNGDNRTADPELWWDNRGGANLQVVEWQRKLGDHLLPSQLFFVPDNGPRARTRVTARFAKQLGTYRWRVWSIGTGGALVLSPWRTFNVIP
jgi:hypothetical protein